MWYCPGANHAPHHAPQEYIEKYRGKFDDGYEAYRTWVLDRMVDRGILPEETRLTPLNPLPKEVANPLDDRPPDCSGRRRLGEGDRFGRQTLVCPLRLSDNPIVNCSSVAATAKRC